MKTRSCIATGAPTFFSILSFEAWLRIQLSDLQTKVWTSKKEKTLKVMEVHEAVLKNFHLYNNGCQNCNDIECCWNNIIFKSFENLVFLRREQVDEEFREDMDNLIDGFLEKNNDLIYLYARSTYTEEETINLCQYYKKYFFTLSRYAGEETDRLMIEKCNGSFLNCRFIYRLLGEYYAPPQIIEMMDEWWAATKIKRWFRNIIHQPAIYPAAERIVWRSIENDGFAHIFAK